MTLYKWSWDLFLWWVPMPASIANLLGSLDLWISGSLSLSLSLSPPLSLYIIQYLKNLKIPAVDRSFLKSLPQYPMSNSAIVVGIFSQETTSQSRLALGCKTEVSRVHVSAYVYTMGYFGPHGHLHVHGILILWKLLLWPLEMLYINTILYRVYLSMAPRVYIIVRSLLLGFYVII